jgi:hypothetical protein
MASAFQTIVEFYVQGGNKKAIQDSLAHRRKLSSDLKSISDGDHLGLLAEIAQEVILLEAGLKRLEEPAQAASKSPSQVPSQTHSELVDLNLAPSAADRPAPAARPEPPLDSKQVEIVLVDISSAPVGEPAVATAQAPPQRVAPVRIIGLTIAGSSEDDAQSATFVDGKRRNDRPT